jgi:tRNA (guanine-N7-)-methyltransferase
MNTFWSTIFGNHHPIEIEIGPGTGTFLQSIAAAHPERNYFAIEHSRSLTARLEAALIAPGLRNVRVIHGDASCIAATVVPAASVAAYHIYFPDAWWKRRHQRRRLFTSDFARALAQTLAPGGHVYLATDVDDVFTLMRATLAAAAVFAEVVDAPSPRTTVTNFERKGLVRGATIHQATFATRVPARPLATPHPSSAAPITPAESPS